MVVFAQTRSLATAIITMVFFSLNDQAAEGSSYGIVPDVDPPSTGSIAGIVGAGGNVGAVLFGLGFRQLDYKLAFNIMDLSILGSSLISVFINIKGQSKMFSRSEEVPESHP